ncbi:TetR/AcrR family transcriptional regulator [Nocardia carnea]|uniref:TetR/AcrR family transcriptional regulator n=1 Tax=Nocardia carnea TaxID=37328 RepID=UPI002457D272|nr:TetR/AcrR family transcriptional regulator [Nocardia carnea]
MARPRLFTDDQVLDAARDVLADPAVTRPTIAHISAASGIRTGSIYLRFASRDELLARLWYRSIKRFHGGLLEALAGTDPLIDAALHIPRYCRAHPTEARAMKMYNRDQLRHIGSEDLRHAIVHINDDIDAALVAAVRRDLGTAEPAALAVAEAAVKAIPYGLVRDNIAGARPIPEWIDDAVRAAAAAVLAECAPRRADLGAAQ